MMFLKKDKDILIYGEFSGYAKSLSKGFKSIGYKCEVLSFNGDGFKKIDGDLCCDNTGIARTMLSMLKMIPKILKFKNVLVVNPCFLDFKYIGPLIILFAKICNIRIILIACGDDVEFIKQGKKGNIANWPYSDVKLPRSNYLDSYREKIIHHMIAIVSHNIIPVMIDYKIAWDQSIYKNKVVDTIPLACDGEVGIFSKTGNVIRIMHGINREGVKGTKIIKKALKRVKEKYGDNVEIIYPEKLSLNDYLKMMNSVDISIDQTKGNSYGMNAIYSLLNYHVVLAPANELFKKDIGITKTPIISIINDEDDIYNKIDILIENKSYLDKIKKMSVDYANTVHNPSEIAARFIKYLKM